MQKVRNETWAHIAIAVFFIFFIWGVCISVLGLIQRIHTIVDQKEARQYDRSTDISGVGDN